MRRAININYWLLVQDPRRLDPRRVQTHVGVLSTVSEDAGPVRSEFDGSVFVNKPASPTILETVEQISAPVMTTMRNEVNSSEGSLESEFDQPKKEDEPVGSEENVPLPEIGVSSDCMLSLVAVDEDSVAVDNSEAEVVYGNDASSFLDPDEHSPVISNTFVIEETYKDLPPLPSYVELTEEQRRNVMKVAVEQIIDSYKTLEGTEYCQIRMALLARLIGQVV